MRALIASLVAVSAALIAQTPAARPPLDGVAAIVNGDVITRSDVTACRTLRLNPLCANLTDEGVVRLLIDRRLELAEVRRFSPPEPAPDLIAARRSQWESQFPAGTDLRALIATTYMDDAALTAWLRDEVRIDGYLRQKFGAPDEKRRARVQAWLDGLLERAEVSINIR